MKLEYVYLGLFALGGLLIVLSCICAIFAATFLKAFKRKRWLRYSRYIAIAGVASICLSYALEYVVDTSVAIIIHDHIYASFANQI